MNQWVEMGLTPDVIAGTVEYMRKNHLTIGGPQSVTNIARDRMGAQTDAPTIPKLTPEVLAGINRNGQGHNGNGHNT
jgi:hypothetical protein